MSAATSLAESYGWYMACDEPAEAVTEFYPLVASGKDVVMDLLVDNHFKEMATGLLVHFQREGKAYVTVIHSLATVKGTGVVGCPVKGKIIGVEGDITATGTATYRNVMDLGALLELLDDIRVEANDVRRLLHLMAPLKYQSAYFKRMLDSTFNVHIL